MKIKLISILVCIVQPLADILSTKLEGVGRVLVGVATQEEFVNLSRATENDWCHGNIRPGQLNNNWNGFYA